MDDRFWQGLPVPAMVLGTDNISAGPFTATQRGARIVALNTAAEPFLNLSARAVVGACLEDDAVRARFRFNPPLDPLIAHARRNGAARLDRAEVLIADGSGGFRPLSAHLYAGQTDEGISLVMAPVAPAPAHPPPRRAARQAIGLAEMLAHEVKNPLAGISGAAQLLTAGLSGADRDLGHLIVDEVRRIVALLDRVERFGDTSPPVSGPVNLHDILEKTRVSAKMGWAKGVEIITRYDPSLPLARGECDLLAQVALNLMKNAVEAGASRLCLRTFYNSSLRAADGRLAPPLHIAFEDNGPGLAPAIADQVFDPFVSGRENGTGLGLALVSKIMADLGGDVTVSSRPGQTVFRVSLPVYKVSPDKPPHQTQNG